MKRFVESLDRDQETLFQTLRAVIKSKTRETD